MFCHKCGTPSLEDADFCQKCGSALIVEDATPQQSPIEPVAPVPPQQQYAAPQTTYTDTPYTAPTYQPPVGAPPRKKKTWLFALISAGVVVIAGIVVFVLWNNRDTYEPPIYSSPPPSPSDTAVEGVSLDKTYTNKEEGFSFRYPGEWDFTDASVYDDDFTEGLIAIAPPSLFANLSVVRGYSEYEGEEDDFFSMYTSVAKAYFQEEYSLIFDDVQIMDVSDMTIDGIRTRKVVFSATEDGVTIVTVQYYYYIGFDFYIVQCLSHQSNFDSYEPVFDAIMDSYRITRTGDTSGTTIDTTPSVDSSITEAEAVRILEAWLDSHPFFKLAGYYGPYDFEEDGEDFYGFPLYNQWREFADILVSKKTGELYMYGSYGDPTIQLDEWYYNTNFKGELLFDDIPLHWIIYQDAAIFLGAPSYEDEWEGGWYYEYHDTGISYSIDEIAWMWTSNPSRLKIDGVTLNQNRAGVVAVFGDPWDEGWEEDYEDSSIKWYYLEYKMELAFERVYTVTFTMPTTDDMVSRITIMQYIV